MMRKGCSFFFSYLAFHPAETDEIAGGHVTNPRETYEATPSAVFVCPPETDDSEAEASGSTSSVYGWQRNKATNIFVSVSGAGGYINYGTVESLHQLPIFAISGGIPTRLTA